jgi:hypothetical protein
MLRRLVLLGSCLAWLSLPVGACSDGAPAMPGDPGEPADAGGTDAMPCHVKLPSCPASPPSWSGQVQGIVSQYCGGCHQDGGVEEAVTNLSTYTGVHAQFGAILSQLNNCSMPLADAAPLPADDEHTLLEWLVCAAPDN